MAMGSCLHRADAAGIRRLEPTNSSAWLGSQDVVLCGLAELLDGRRMDE